MKNNAAHKDTREDIQDQIDDYILGLLSEKDHKETQFLISNNANYNEYYLQAKELLEHIQVNNTPDPGSDFWKKFPDQVLEKCHQKQKQTPSFWQQCVNWWQSLSTQTSFFQPAMAFALVLAIVVILVNPNNKTQTPLHDPLAMQNILWQKIAPTNDILEQLKTSEANAYSFSKIDSSNAFTVGKNLSLSIAYFIKQEYIQSAELLKGLKGFKTDKTLDTLVNSLQQENPFPSSVAIEYKNLLTQIEQQFSTEDYALFITGSWLADIEMAVASKQYHLLTELNQTQYILQQLKPLALPEKTYDHLQQLDILLKKDQYSRKELTKIKWLTSSVQTVLS